MRRQTEERVSSRQASWNNLFIHKVQENVIGNGSDTPCWLLNLKAKKVLLSLHVALQYFIIICLLLNLNHFASSQFKYDFYSNTPTDRKCFCLTFNLNEHFLAFTTSLCQSRECQSQPFMTFTEEIILPPICLPSSSQHLALDFFSDIKKEDISTERLKAIQ